MGQKIIRPLSLGAMPSGAPLTWVARFVLWATLLAAASLSIINRGERQPSPKIQVLTAPSLYSSATHLSRFDRHTERLLLFLCSSLLVLCPAHQSVVESLIQYAWIPRRCRTFRARSTDHLGNILAAGRYNLDAGIDKFSPTTPSTTARENLFVVICSLPLHLHSDPGHVC